MPRPIEPLLDDIFYTFYKAPKTGAYDNSPPDDYVESGGGMADSESTAPGGECHCKSCQSQGLLPMGPDCLYNPRRQAGSGIDWEDEDDEEQKTRNKNWDDDLDEAVDDGFGGKKAPPFGSEERKNYSRSAGESTSDDFYGGDKPDDYYDDLNDGPEGEDKHPDPFVQRMRDQEKNSAIDPQDIAQPNYYFVESVNGD